MHLVGHINNSLFLLLSCFHPVHLTYTIMYTLPSTHMRMNVFCHPSLLV